MGLSVVGMGVLLWALFMGFVRCWYGGTAVEFLRVCPLLVWGGGGGGNCCGVFIGLSVAGMEVLLWAISMGFSVAGMGVLLWSFCGFVRYWYGVFLWAVSMGLSVAGMGVMLWSFYEFVRCWYGGIAVEFLWICPLLVWG